MGAVGVEGVVDGSHDRERVVDADHNQVGGVQGGDILHRSIQVDINISLTFLST